MSDYQANIYESDTTHFILCPEISGRRAKGDEAGFGRAIGGYQVDWSERLVTILPCSTRSLWCPNQTKIYVWESSQIDEDIEHVTSGHFSERVHLGVRYNLA